MEGTVPGRSWGCIHFLPLGVVAPGGMALTGHLGRGWGWGAGPSTLSSPGSEFSR